MHPSAIRLRRAAGFSLIELLVAVAIIVVLAAILLPVVSAVRGTALQVACAGQQRQIGVALLLYAQSWAGILPPRYVSNFDLPAAWHAARRSPCAPRWAQAAGAFCASC